MSAARPLTQAESDVLDERRRQIHQEGFAAGHDDAHRLGELARAGACYAHHAAHSAYVRNELALHGRCPTNWPMTWATSWWKPVTPRRDLVKAAALIVAEIERLDRQDARNG